MGAAAVSPAYAWSNTGAQSLGVAANAIDVWTFTCPILFPRARAQVNDIAPFNNPAVMSVVLGKGGVTAQATDFNLFFLEHNANYSASASVPSTFGTYTVAFSKSAGGVDGYNGRVECYNLVGGVWNPAMSLQINQ